MESGGSGTQGHPQLFSEYKELHESQFKKIMSGKVPALSKGTNATFPETKMKKGWGGDFSKQNVCMPKYLVKGISCLGVSSHGHNAILTWVQQTQQKTNITENCCL